jgi:hypothetical protein
MKQWVAGREVVDGMALRALGKNKMEENEESE